MEFKKTLACLVVGLSFAACSHNDGSKGGGSNPPVSAGAETPTPKPDQPVCDSQLKNVSEMKIRAIWSLLPNLDLSELAVGDRVIYQGFRLAEAIDEVLHITIDDCAFSQIFTGFFDENGNKRSEIDTAEIIKNL